MSLEEMNPKGAVAPIEEAEENLSVDAAGNPRSRRTLLDQTVGNYSDAEEIEFNQAIRAEQKS